MGYILHCFKCQHREIAPKPFPEAAAKCPECGTKMDYAGPLWIGKIFDSQFIELMLQENSRVAFKGSNKISKLLSLAKAEAEAPATYYVLDKLSGKLGLPAPAVAPFLVALRDAGFKATLTHFNSRGLRTDAPALVMHEVLRKVAKPSA
jgi:tRNA (guanine26-N2/guanine27-N2)-dimethyltransferase